MPKLDVAGSARRKREKRRLVGLPNAVEGQVEELCRDLAVQAKQTRQLQEQADELRTAIRQWAGQSDADPYEKPPNRGGRR